VRAEEELNAGPAGWARTALEVPLRYAQAGSSLAWAALAGARRFDELAHHPRNDVVDARHRTRFYYHAHDAHRWNQAEHGHFHLFVDGDAPGDFMHLAALSLDARGQPQRWFSTNGWVTGERWRPADTAIAALKDFRVSTPGRLAPVARWLTAMVGLFATDLEGMLRARDARLATRLSREPIEAVWSDRSLDVLSERPAGLQQRLAALGLV